MGDSDYLRAVSGLAKGAIFTINVFAENKSLINHKCVCGARNRHFWVGAVYEKYYSVSLSFASFSFKRSAIIIAGASCSMISL